MLFQDASSRDVGKEIDSYKNIPVYDNGDKYSESHGKNYSFDGYYYGQKWQCVEYVKRFYKDALGHRMPNLYGNAIDFFDKNVPQGGLNKDRGLLQFRNGSDERPFPDDLMIFTDSKYGHVGIVTLVGDDFVEIIQQNVKGKSREKFSLKNEDGDWVVGTTKKPAGWLRLPSKN